MRNFIYLVLLVTFSWVSLLLLTYCIFILIVPLPPISGDLSGRMLSGVLKVFLSAVLFLVWLASLLAIRNYIAKRSVLS
jgi:hypothetical protein